MTFKIFWPRLPGRIRRGLSAAVPVLLAAGLFFSAVADAQAAVRLRKNIDDQTPQELAAYEHAIDMMRKKSLANKNDREGYLWQAWVHNCNGVPVPDSGAAVPIVADPAKNGWFSDSDAFCPPMKSPPAGFHTEHPGMCEHGKDLFLPWHRAEFFYYEQALRAADPEGTSGPSTKDVTVPYWNFTQTPSGVRFPKAFENKTSPLFYPGRTEGPPTAEDKQRTSPYLLAYLIRDLRWPQFGGYRVGGPGNYGAFESMIHNYMHDAYIGGVLKHPSTAGLDPLFFSYHAFIDYILEEWIDSHAAAEITSAGQYLRGQQSLAFANPPGFTPGSGLQTMGQVKNYLDIAALGYGFDPGGRPQFFTEAELTRLTQAYDAENKQGFGVAPESFFTYLLSGDDGDGYQSGADPAVTQSVSVTLPLPAEGSVAAVELVRKPLHQGYSYQADVYLHPASVAADLKDTAFRSRYLATSVNYWELSGAGHDHGEMSSTRLMASVQQPVASIQAGPLRKEAWVLTVGITPSGTGARPDDFEQPRLTAIPAH